MMPQGKYYIGDLCYVIRDKEWQESCDIKFPDGGARAEGEFTLKNGKRVAEFSTAYGDGIYRASNGAELCVDSGGIGCIRVEDIDLAGRDCNIEGGTIVEFPRPFEPETDGDGRLTFGHITVNTNDDDDEDEDYQDEEEDEGDE